MPRRTPRSLGRGQLGELFFQMRDAVVVVNGEWLIQRFNPAGERLLGYAEDVVVGRSLAHLFAYESEFQRARQLLVESMPAETGGGGEPFVARMRSRAGRQFPARLKAIRLEEEDRLAVLLHEEYELELGTEDQALVRHVNQMAETALSVVGSTDLQQVAQAFADLAKELLDADFTAVALARTAAAGGLEFTTFAYNAPRHLFPERLPRAVGLLGLALESRTILRLNDIRGHPNGVGLPVKHPPLAALIAVPLLYEGRVVGELLAANRVGRAAFGELDEAIARHLGSLVVAAVETARLQLAVRELEHAKSDFLRLASHELRGPITVVSGYLSMVADGSFGVELPEAVMKLLQDRMREMEQMVAQMLDTARLEDGRVELALALVDLAQISIDVAAAAAEAAPGRRIEVAAPHPALTSGDRGRLRVVIANLVDNALKFSLPAEPVSVSVQREGEWALVRVTDRGLGIAEAALPKLFTQFGRIVTAENAHIPGTGLGLYLARELARLHGGDLTAVSRPGLGSSFALRLPAADRSDAGT